MNENSFDKELLDANLIGAKSLDELYEKESLLVGVKLAKIVYKPIDGALDYQHLKAIHKYLFEDIYTFAGLDRYEAKIFAKFGKGSTIFTPYEKIPKVSKTLFDALKDENYFKNQSKEEFIKSMAIFMNGLNLLHPFREGNGRTQRVFMQYLAIYNGYQLNFNDIDSQEMTMASVYGARGDMRLLEKIFQKGLK